MSGSPQSRGHAKASLATLTLGALGVVYGDIGTSPLYTMKECLHAGRHHHPARDDVLGILSLMFWSLTMVVTVKYLAFVMRADNKGEGGILRAARARARRRSARERRAPRRRGPAGPHRGRAPLRRRDHHARHQRAERDGGPRRRHAACASSLIVPLTWSSSRASSPSRAAARRSVGQALRPVMVLWFSTSSPPRRVHIVKHAGRPGGALAAPRASRYLAHHGATAFKLLGSVVLAVTGGEALYADMGHFGRKPIRLAWLALRDAGAGARLLRPGRARARPPGGGGEPFFSMVPAGAPTYALVALSSCATVIASQAVISGVFSLTRQAMQLGYFPRVTVRHTADRHRGADLRARDQLAARARRASCSCSPSVSRRRSPRPMASR
jgi:KUP system potassium uptake protein